MCEVCAFYKQTDVHSALLSAPWLSEDILKTKLLVEAVDETISSAR